MAKRCAVTIEVPSEHRCAEVSGQGAVAQLHSSFGITDVIGNCDNYLRPQEWAFAWAANDFHGVRYRLSHGTALFGWALFGERGQGRWNSTEWHELTSQFLADQGLAPPSVPRTDALDFISADSAVELLEERLWNPESR